MNQDSASSSTLGAAPVRKDRGPIASQACDVCRQRKQRCDENRPKCGLCTRLKIECNYREPVPTKKDKTMVEILDRVKNIEVMLEQFPQIATGIAELKQSQTPLTHSSLNNPLSFKAEGHTFATTSSHPNETITGRMHTNTIYPHYTASHKILLWPAIQQLLLKAAPSSNVNGKFLERGPVFMVRTQASRPPLSLDIDLQERPFVGMQSLASRVVGGSRTTFPGLIPEAMHQLAVSYFDTFNFLYPFMDRQTFFSETLAKVMSEGFDGDMESVIALLIFALGEVALEGSCGSPVDIYQARPSGIRGGSGLSKPPGVSFFNEAMKKIGSVLTEWTALTGNHRKATLLNVRIGIVPPWKLSKMDANSSCSEGYTFLTAAGVRQLASQLTQWRGLLPSALQWVEDEPASFPYVQTPERDIENIDPNFTSPMSQQSYRPVLFSTDIDEEPVRYPYAYDIQVATLRTRYYYAKYMVYRPFVYKVLHSPELVTPEDAQNVAECLRVCYLYLCLSYFPFHHYLDLRPY
ncbi:putative transcription factor cys6 protein [Botrytis cinerea BcDW1]|uniref:Putative transcription factor cys6 protein n=1 Tax=Botryotinia fuckeliana (strain BcDW1) TaxID=1290391 RepID=M7UC54_BOTF1|nr:putative transcription factor cys6 protein [Botrytis cinerea BcDW1]